MDLELIAHIKINFTHIFLLFYMSGRELKCTRVLHYISVGRVLLWLITNTRIRAAFLAGKASGSTSSGSLPPQRPSVTTVPITTAPISHHSAHQSPQHPSVTIVPITTAPISHHSAHHHSIYHHSTHQLPQRTSLQHLPHILDRY